MTGFCSSHWMFRELAGQWIQGHQQSQDISASLVQLQQWDDLPHSSGISGRGQTSDVAWEAWRSRNEASHERNYALEIWLWKMAHSWMIYPEQIVMFINFPELCAMVIYVKLAVDPACQSLNSPPSMAIIPGTKPSKSRTKGQTTIPQLRSYPLVI